MRLFSGFHIHEHTWAHWQARLQPRTNMHGSACDNKLEKSVKNKTKQNTWTVRWLSSWVKAIATHTWRPYFGPWNTYKSRGREIAPQSCSLTSHEYLSLYTNTHLHTHIIVNKNAGRKTPLTHVKSERVKFMETGKRWWTEHKKMQLDKQNSFKRSILYCGS